MRVCQRDLHTVWLAPNESLSQFQSLANWSEVSNERKKYIRRFRC